MRDRFFVPSLLRWSVVFCSACSLVIGDVPDNPASNDAGPGGATTSVGGHAGQGGSIDAGSDVASSGVGGSSTGGSGVGGGSGGAGGAIGGGGGGVGGVAGSAGGMSSGGAGGRGGAGGGASGAGPSGGSAGAKMDASIDVGSGGGRDASVPPDTGVDAFDPCDRDMDHRLSRLGNCGGDDCDDNQPDVHPGQTMYFTDPTHPGGTEFDYDCNGVPDLDPQYKAVDCSSLLGLNCNQSGSGFLGANLPACGQAADFGHCQKSLTSCDPVVEQQGKKMPCK